MVDALPSLSLFLCDSFSIFGILRPASTPGGPRDRRITTTIRPQTYWKLTFIESAFNRVNEAKERRSDLLRSLRVSIPLRADTRFDPWSESTVFDDEPDFLRELSIPRRIRIFPSTAGKFMPRRSCKDGDDIERRRVSDACNVDKF